MSSIKLYNIKDALFSTSICAGRFYYEPRYFFFHFQTVFRPIATNRRFPKRSHYACFVMRNCCVSLCVFDFRHVYRNCITWTFSGYVRTLLSDISTSDCLDRLCFTKCYRIRKTTRGRYQRDRAIFIIKAEGDRI